MPKEVTADTHTVMTYNIEGGQRPDDVIAIVKDVRPHILAIQEAGPTYRNLLDKLGMHYEVTLSPKFNLHVATASSAPIKEIKKLESFRNAGLVTTIDIPGIGPVAVCNVHLSPFMEEERMRELETALRELGNSGATMRIIAGDLNSLSPQDSYPPDLQKNLNPVQRLKFMRYGVLLHEVISRLLEEGYVDVAVSCGKSDVSTVPTPSNKDRAHDQKLRLDYVFVSGNLERHIKDYKVIKNKATNLASDHYPVVVVFEKPRQSKNSA